MRATRLRPTTMLGRRLVAREQRTGPVDESLTVHEPIPHELFERVAAFEVARARRYNRSLSAVGLPAWGTAGIRLRQTDILGRSRDGGRLIALLPETDRFGAQVLLARIGLPDGVVRSSGIVVFPTEAFGTRDLLESVGA